jgi:hypothetical protein
LVDHFYRHLLDFPGQAIVVENGDPPADVVGQVGGTPSGPDST